MTWKCHLPTLHHTSTHMLGTHVCFRVIPKLRRSFTSETLDRGDPQIYPYSFLRTRVDQWTFCLYLCLFSKYVHGEPMLDNSGFDIQIQVLLSVSRVCEQRQTHDLDMPSTNIASHLYTYVRDTCRFSSDSGAPAVIHLRNPRSLRTCPNKT